MTVGIRLRKDDGTLIADYTTPFGRIMGTVQIGTSDGSLDVTAGGQTLDGILWAIARAVDNPAGLGFYVAMPQLSISGPVISWTFASASGAVYRTPCEILYGYR